MSIQNKIKAREIASKVSEKDTTNYVLKNASLYEASLLRDIAIHIDYLKVIGKKVPEWFSNGNTLPYQGINLEQSSSQNTAIYKSQYLRGNLGVDLTGGLGVDTYFISKNFKTYIHNEPNLELSAIVQHNFKELYANNIKFSNTLAENFEWNSTSYDWVYLDPSRRSKENSKLFKIEDCLPNLIDIKNTIFEHSENIMVKYSPMLDIKLGIQTLKNVKEIIVLSEKNEVKELIFILKKDYISEPTIKCVNLETQQSDYEFNYSEEISNKSEYSEPLNFLYEPNSSIMKAGAFNSISKKFNLKKLAINSHLYTSQELVDEFPGRKFQISEVTNYDRKRLKNVVSDHKANISCRNFPIKPEEIKKQMNWKEGGDQYLFFTQTEKNKKIVIITSKL